MKKYFRRLASPLPTLTARYALRKPTCDERRPVSMRIWNMETIARPLLTLTILAASLWITSPSDRAGALIYSQSSDGQSTFGPSQLWAATGVNSEVADESI